MYKMVLFEYYRLIGFYYGNMKEMLGEINKGRVMADVLVDW